MSCVNSQGFGSYSRVCKGLDEENAIFLLRGEKCFGFVRGNGGFFGARAFLPRVSPGLENELFRAEAQRLMMGEFASDLYLPQHY